MVEVYIPENVEFEKGKIAEMVGDALQRCVAGRRVGTYPRSRWTGGDQAWDDFIMLDAIHGICSEIWPRWCRQCGPVGRGRGGFPVGGAVGASVAEAHEQGDEEGAEGLEASRGLAGSGEVGGGVGSGADDIEQQRLENELHRQMATSWLQGKPLTRAIVLRQVMEPLRQLLQLELEVGSKAWAGRQDARAAVSMMQGLGTDGRTFPLVEAACGRMTQRFHQQVRLLFAEEELWKHMIPSYDMNIRTRSAVAVLPLETVGV